MLIYRLSIIFSIISPTPRLGSSFGEKRFQARQYNSTLVKRSNVSQHPPISMTVHFHSTVLKPVTHQSAGEDVFLLTVKARWALWQILLIIFKMKTGVIVLLASPLLVQARVESRTILDNIRGGNILDSIRGGNILESSDAGNILDNGDFEAGGGSLGAWHCTNCQCSVKEFQAPWK